MRNWSIAIALSAASAAHAAPPGRVEIDYEVRHNGSAVADIALRMEHDGSAYRLSEQWRGRGIYFLLGRATRTSRGVIGPEGLRPLEFTDERTARTTARASFDWSAMKITLQYKGEPESRPLPPNAHDRLSSFIGPAFIAPITQAVEFNVADGRGVSSYVYEPGVRERVVTPAGEFDALSLVKRKDGPQDRDARIWFAVDRSRLPVRVLVTDSDGTRVEQVATRILAP